MPAQRQSAPGCLHAWLRMAVAYHTTNGSAHLAIDMQGLMAHSRGRNSSAVNQTGERRARVDHVLLLDRQPQDSHQVLPFDTSECESDLNH